MSKTYYPPPQIVPVQTNATTASPNLVKAITLDPAYEMKTVQVVLIREQGTLRMSVYRASTTTRLGCSRARTSCARRRV